MSVTHDICSAPVDWHVSMITHLFTGRYAWYKELGQHESGEFSMAVVQANSLLEDQSQIEPGSLSATELGPHGTFVGIYDGHGGPETARYINNHLFLHLQKFAIE
jgi:pyruvate dehydrogenase phosphatase